MKAFRIFPHFYIVCLAAAVLTACSLYESEGHEAIEKDSGGLVTSTGVSFSPKTSYRCSNLVAVPSEWQTNTTSLDEYVTASGMKAVLLTTQTEAPTVVVYSWLDHHAEACSLTVLDAKLSSQNLSDVVAFGESLILAARR